MQNIVGHVDMDLDHQNIDLELFYRHYNIECTFQRSMFPGLVYRAQNSNVVMLIFGSGRVVKVERKDADGVWFTQPFELSLEHSLERAARHATSRLHGGAVGGPS